MAQPQSVLSEEPATKPANGNPLVEDATDPLPAAPGPMAPRQFTASIFPGQGGRIPPDFAEAVVELETSLGMPVWLLVHNGQPRHPFGTIRDGVRMGFYYARPQMVASQRLAVLIDSPGGQTKSAYQIAKILRERSGGFTALVPRYAKRAGTLLALGADRIVLSDHGELGPLDAQFSDPMREERRSALDEVQALSELHESSMEALDLFVSNLGPATLKKIQWLVPIAMHFTAELMRPVYDKVDTVEYTKVSRVLRVAEEYATRLLQKKYGEEKAHEIAAHLVEDYPEHDFLIDREEANSFGLQADAPTPHDAGLMEKLIPHLGSTIAIGRVTEVK